MGTIIERPRKGGGFGYNAQVVVKRDGAVHRETRTFDRRPAAAAWIKRRERELREPGALAAAKVEDPTLHAVIARYVTDSRRPLGKTKAQVLRAIQGTDLAAKACSAIGSADLVDFLRALGEGRQPQTVANYAAHLAAVFAVARPAWGYPLDPGAMKDAQTVARRLGVLGKSKRRERRPTLPELDKIMQHFGAVRRRRPDSVPMQAVVAFAIFSTRRQEEIVRLTWADLDVAHARVLVRDLKHPGETRGNDVWCELPPEALAIVDAQPRADDRIFPYTTDAVSAAFTRACALLGIQDLHFHDLRHEGVTRLFEMGRTLPLAASVSGHRSWGSLQRYTHVRATGDRYAGWRWLAGLTGLGSAA